MSGPRPSRAWSAAILAAAAAYYAAIVCHSSFVTAATRYFLLVDDAMISMRYARNLVHGHGLVWNPGEAPVEGFTNPLWTLLMAAVHLLPLPPHRLTLVVQVIGAGILVGLLMVVRGLAMRLLEHGRGVGGRPEWTSRLPIIAMALVGFYFPLAYWTLTGMEVGLLALITTAATSMLLSGRRLPALYALLGIGVLVRMDFVVTLLTLAALGATLHPAGRAKHLALGIGTALATLALLTSARLIYFHDLLPNTYYLKLTGYPTGLRVIRGAWALVGSVLRSNGLLALVPIGALLIARENARRALMVVVAPFLAQCAYSVWVGGDAWEDAIPCNRYLAIATPGLLVAAAWTVTVVAGRLDPRGRLGPVPATGLALAALLAIAPFRATLLLDPLPGMQKNQDLVIRALAVRAMTQPGATVAATGIGTIGYYSERSVVDLLGKCDRHIARLPMHRAVGQNPLTYFFPGHLKWDYRYSLGVLKPDIVCQLWENPADAAPYLRDYVVLRAAVDRSAVQMAARRGSERVRWPR